MVLDFKHQTSDSYCTRSTKDFGIHHKPQLDSHLRYTIITQLINYSILRTTWNCKLTFTGELRVLLNCTYTKKYSNFIRILINLNIVRVKLLISRSNVGIVSATWFALEETFLESRETLETKIGKVIDFEVYSCTLYKLTTEQNQLGRGQSMFYILFYFIHNSASTFCIFIFHTF